MSTPRTIAIIGATGEKGSAAAGILSKGNNRLLLFGRDQVKTDRVVDEIKKITSSADVEAYTCAREASWEADVIVLAVPFGAEAEVASRIRDVANRKVVISMADRPETGIGVADPLEGLLPYSTIIRASTIEENLLSGL